MREKGVAEDRVQPRLMLVPLLEGGAGYAGQEWNPAMLEMILRRSYAVPPPLAHLVDLVENILVDVERQIQ
jgi:hypothetical protein